MSRILSVCIPTYNRLNYLKESLSVLLPQAEKLCVDVCVSDNNSSDGTADYLKSLSSLYKCLKYIIQPMNCGLERNMISAMSMADTNYILPIGDDEIIMDGGLSLIIDKIKKNPDLDILIFDGWHTGLKSKDKRRHLPNHLHNYVFHNPIVAFQELWDKMPPGSFVVTKNCFANVYYEKFFGTSHAYTGMVWEYLLEKFKLNGKIFIECLSDPIILFLSVKKSYSSYTARVHLYEIPQWFLRLSPDYQESVSNILQEYLSRQSSFSALVNYRAIGQLDFRTVNEFMNAFSNKQKRKALIVAKIPLSAAKIISMSIKILGVVRRLIRWIFQK